MSVQRHGEPGAQGTEGDGRAVPLQDDLLVGAGGVGQDAPESMRESPGDAGKAASSIEAPAGSRNNTAPDSRGNVNATSREGPVAFEDPLNQAATVWEDDATGMSGGDAAPCDDAPEDQFGSAASDTDTLGNGDGYPLARREAGVLANRSVAEVPMSPELHRQYQSLAVDPAQIAAEYVAVLAAKKASRTEGQALDELADDKGRNGLADALTETIRASEPVWQGSYLTVDRVDVTLPDGRPAEREVIRHPGAVAIIALDSQGRILLVHQYRTALERVTREIPAGKLEPGETAEECANRELFEETGYRAGTMRYLIPVATAAGYSDEIIHLFMATDLVAGESHPDTDEFIVSEWADLAGFIDEVLDGKVEDSKTIIAAFVCDAVAHRL